MEKIVFLDRKTVKAEFKTPTFPHVWWEFEMTGKDDVVERLKEATIAITNKVQIRKEEIDQLPNLRLIQVAATGTDCVDSKYCREKEIIVSNIRNYSTISVSEHVFSLILALRRNLLGNNNFAQNGDWQRSDIFCSLDFPILDLHSSTLGIIGYGAIGKAVEKIALAFGMKVLIAERKGVANTRIGRVTFDELISSSDIITLHCPLTDETRGLIGSEELRKMKHNSLLINCGRGGLVDENALVSALKNGQIGGAGVDVLSNEPPTLGNALLNESVPNLIVTPHVAWASIEAMQTLANQLIENLESFVKGNPQNVVN